MRRLLTIISCISLLVFPLTGCGGAPNGRTTDTLPETTDELFSDSQRNAELEIFKEDGHVYTVEGHYELPELAGYGALVDGGYYKLTADITYLNGGVAGYVDYPQIDRVISIEEIPATETPEEAEDTELMMSIDGVEVDVTWEENESVQALREMVADEPLEVQMSMYSDFEQVGSLGAALPKNDEQMTTDAGDIVLYAGDQIVVFYGSNSWAYTRLGKIEGKTSEELRQLLGRKDVTAALRIG